MKNGIILGFDEATNEVVIDDSSDNVLAVGPTRSGKTASIAIPTGLCWQGNAFFFDHKGEIYSRTSGYRKNQMGQNVKILSLTGGFRGSLHWNPLEELDIKASDAENQVWEMAGILIDSIRKRYQGTAPKEKVRSFLFHLIAELLLERQAEQKPAPSLAELAAETWKHTDNREVAQSAAFVLAAILNTSVFPETRETTAFSDFKIRDLFRHADGQKTTFYLISCHEPLEYIFLHCYLRQLRLCSEKQNLLVMLDDFMGISSRDTLRQLDALLPESAEKGIRFCLTAQDMGRFTKEYKREMNLPIMDHCGIHIYFEPDAADELTASFIKSELREGEDIHADFASCLDVLIFRKNAGPAWLWQMDTETPWETELTARSIWLWQFAYYLFPRVLKLTNKPQINDNFQYSILEKLKQFFHALKDTLATVGAQ